MIIKIKLKYKRQVNKVVEFWKIKQIVFLMKKI